MLESETFLRRLISLIAASVAVAVMAPMSPPAMAIGRSSTPIATSAGPLGVGPGIMNHPVRVLPSALVAVPAGWPLDDQGAITCLTCHTKIPANVGHQEPDLRDFDSDGPHPTDFCTKCHSCVDEESAESVHWLALGQAHVANDRAMQETESAALDEHSRRCLSCHDGVNAIESANGTPSNRIGGDFGNEGRNHPVGVDYRAAGRPSYLSPLRPASLLPKEVPLPGGKVSCISCHDLFSGSRYRLTVPIQRSRLCLTCHAMN